MGVFSLFYLLIAAILLVVATPYLLYLSRKPKYAKAIPQRFFLYQNPPFESASIWFHVCSFGEAQSLKPLLDELQEAVNISVTTQTGYEAASKYHAEVRYLPYELWLVFWIRKQKVLVVSEAELWYMLFLMAKQKGARTILINARVSDNSYQSYQRFSWVYRRIFANIDKVFAQSQKDKERLLALGAKEVIVTGNIKAYGEIQTSKTFKNQAQEVITLASTHAGEEAILLQAIDYHDKKILVVPRHPERFIEVGRYLADFAKEKGLSYHAFSQREEFDSDVIMIDKMGELINIYAISDVVYLGGSFVENVGGHNPLEPATFGCKIISGKHIFNQKSLYPLVENIEMVEMGDIVVATKRAKPTSVLSKGDIAPIIEAIQDVG